MRERTTILIADDEVDDRISLRDLLAAKGYAVVEAANTDEAVKVAVDTVPDLIVLDIEMPPEDGYVVCKRLRSHPRTSNVPILMLTCHGFVEERVIGLNAGADDYLVKPCENAELLARIDALFRRYPPQGHFFDRLKKAHDSVEAAEAFRRPIVVLSIDVQGASTPPASSSQEYLRPVVFHDYHTLVEEAVAGRGGTLVAWAGDGGTSEFSDPVQAVAAAQEILQRRSTHNRICQLNLRIGIAAGLELLEPGALTGRRISQTHNRAGHFQKHGSPNTITIGKEINAVLPDTFHFRERFEIDGQPAFENC